MLETQDSDRSNRRVALVLGLMIAIAFGLLSLSSPMWLLGLVFAPLVLLVVAASNGPAVRSD